MHDLQTIVAMNNAAAENYRTAAKLRAELDYLDQLVAYEGGQLNEEETIKLFQTLIDNGMAWKLQGHYGRIATNLIYRGLCVVKKEAKCTKA